jgi:N-acetylmuramoyl-L-alanine amidase
MLLQFKMLIVSMFMATSADSVQLPINMDKIDSLKEITCLSQAVHGEAGNQSLSGKIAVAYVIINRSKDSNFPSDICGVIHQKGQFNFLSAVKHLKEERPEQKKQMEDCIRASFMAYNKDVPDPSFGSLYFINPKIARYKGWLKHLTRVARIDDHDFYKKSNKA